MTAKNKPSKRWWALPLVLGAALCIGACAGPLLAAAGIAAACEWTLPGASWLEPIGITLVVISIIGIVLSYRRARRCTTTRESAGAPVQQCECVSSTPQASESTTPR